MIRIADILIPRMLREGEGPGGGGGDGGGGTPAGDGGDGGGSPPETVEVDFDGEKVQLPGKVAESVTALREKADAADAVRAPETYALNLPEALQGKVEVNTEHPMYGPAAEWARKHNLSQDAFDELVAIQVAHEAEGAEVVDEEAEKAKLIDAFNDGGKLTDEQAQAKANEIGKWAAGLVQADAKKNPALLNELAILTATADGVALLQALKSKLGEVRPPRPGGGNANPEISTEQFYEEIFPKDGKS